MRGGAYPGQHFVGDEGATRRSKSRAGARCGASSTLDAAARAPAPTACAFGTGPQMRTAGMIASALRIWGTAGAAVRTERSWRPPCRHANADGCGPTDKSHSSPSHSAIKRVNRLTITRDSVLIRSHMLRKDLIDFERGFRNQKMSTPERDFVTATFVYQVPLITAGGLEPPPFRASAEKHPLVERHAAAKETYRSVYQSLAPFKYYKKGNSPRRITPPIAGLDHAEVARII